MSNKPYVKGKKKRETLWLPAMGFVVADDWMDKLGYERFCTWLKFHTWVDRKDANRDYDKVPMSLEASWEKLGISKTKFYRLIAPLWEYGLIDIVEYEESTRIGQKPKNIVVYEYPFHEEERMFKELEKLRDWKTDYDSKSKDSGQLGGRPRKSPLKKKDEKPAEKRQETRVTVHRFKNKTVKKPVVIHRFKIETVHGFKTKTVTVSKLKPNNVSNNSNNYQITPNNVQRKNLSILESINKLDLPTKIKAFLETKMDRLILHKIDLSDIEILFHAYREKMGHVEFALVLGDVLKVKKFTHSFKAYFRTSLDKFLENSLAANHSEGKVAGGSKPSGRKEMVPDFMDEEKKKEPKPLSKEDQIKALELFAGFKTDENEKAEMLAKAEQLKKELAEEKEMGQVANNL